MKERPFDKPLYGLGMELGTSLTPTQRKIIERLPATADELAVALYNRATQQERRLVYVHIALLRRRLNGNARIVTRRRERGEHDESPCRVVYELQEEP